MTDGLHAKSGKALPKLWEIKRKNKNGELCLITVTNLLLFGFFCYVKQSSLELGLKTNNLKHPKIDGHLLLDFSYFWDYTKTHLPNDWCQIAESLIGHTGLLAKKDFTI